MSCFKHLNCPLDQLPLNQHEGTLVCPEGHSFDIAKSGYINLLPVQNKQSKDPGDSKEMVAARQNFLNSQSYEPIALAIYEAIQNDLMQSSLIQEEQTISVLDAGCGEGYYLSYLQQLLQERLVDSIGLDISKWAVLAASKRNKNIGWIVGSNANLPMPSDRFNRILCLFGFPVWHEFHRVLVDDGYVFLANAGAKHLIELRQILYPEIHPHTPNNYKTIEGFSIEYEKNITFQFEVQSNQALMELVSMTPHLYKASYDGKQALSQVHSLVITADVTLTCLRKNNNKGAASV